jgi:ABC-type transporter Mla MlaB component
VTKAAFTELKACEGKGTMLRITRVDTPFEQKLILEGRLTEPWIRDLSSHWEQTRHAYPERKFVVDLRGVMRVDRAGEYALAQMKTEGAGFLASGIRMKYLLKHLAMEAQQPTHSRGRTAGH